MAKLALVALVVLSLYSAGDAKKILCFYDNQTPYRNAGCQYNPDDVCPKYCTHIVYSYALVNEDGRVTPGDPNSDLSMSYGKAGYAKINDLKNHEHHKDIQTILVIGSPNCRKAFSTIAASKSLRQEFASNVAKYLKYYDFNGALIDWHLPQADDKANYAALVEVLRKEMDAAKLTLGIAAPPYETQQELGFAMSALRSADFVAVEGYFYRDVWGYGVFHPSPLRQCAGDDYVAADIDNVATIVEAYARKGLEKEKIIVAAYGYGRSFALKDPSKPVKIGSPAVEGTYQECTLMGGILNFDEACDAAFEVVHDKSCSATLRVRNGFVAAVESPESVAAKAEFAKNYGGMMFKNMDGDDWDGSCGEKQQLLSIIHATLME